MNIQIYKNIIGLRTHIFTALLVTLIIFSTTTIHAKASEQKNFFSQNIEKLTELVLQDRNELLDNVSPQDYPSSLSTKKLQEIIYIGSTENYVCPNSNNIDDITSINLIFNDESTELVDIKKEVTTSNISIYFNHLLIYETENQLNEELINSLSSKIETTSLDTLLQPYGGRLPATVAMGSNSLYLDELHVANNNQIDIYNLDFALEDLQADSKNTAEKMMAPFKNYHQFSFLSSEEQADFLNKIDQDFNSLLFAYLYFYKWYGYEIGNVKINDLIYAKSDLFSKDSISSEDSLYNLIAGFANDPWPTVDGAPWVYSLFQTEYIFDASTGLRINNRGFTLDAFSEGTISSIIEYLIRIFEGTTDYNSWLANQGFTIAYGEPTGIDVLDNQQHNLWSTLKYFERDAINKKYKQETYNPSIFTIILSMENKNAVSFAVAANDLTFVKDYGGTDKNKVMAQTVANDKNTFLGFLWNTGSEQVKESIKTMVESNWIYINFDTGEFTDGSHKNFYLRSSYFLRDFLTPLSYQVANRSSRNIGGIALSHSVVLSGPYAELSSEYTISHESTHLYDDLMMGGLGLRIDQENVATMSENQFNIYGWDTLSLNYFYSNSQTDGWNKKVPKSNEELQNYTRNFIDLNSAWNIVYAEYIFSDIEKNYDKIYQINYSEENGSNVIAKRMNKSDIDKLNINIDSESFISDLVTNRIYLPTNIEDDEISLSTGYSYDLMHYRANAFFYVPVAKDKTFEKYPKNYIDGFTHFWLFENMSISGMDGYRNYATNVLGESDYEVLKSTLGEDPNEYLIRQYNRVKDKISTDQLIDYTYERLEEEVSKLQKSEFIQTYMEEHNNVQDDLFRVLTESTPTLEITDLTTPKGIIGQTNSFNFTIQHSDLSEKDSLATNISVTLDLNLDYDLIKEVKLEVLDDKNQILEEDTLEVEKNSITLPDLNYSNKYRLTVSGTPWNNTIENSLANYSINLTYNDGSETKITSAKDFMKVNSGLFGFSEVPEVLNFEPVKKSYQTKIISNRINEDWAISINDYRGTNSDDNETQDRCDWELLASTTGFHNKDGKEIPSDLMSLIFVEDEKETILSASEIPIVSHEVMNETPRTDNLIVNTWTKNNGFKIAIYNSSLIPSNESYRATVSLELRTAP